MHEDKAVFSEKAWAGWASRFKDTVASDNTSYGCEKEKLSPKSFKLRSINGVIDGSWDGWLVPHPILLSLSPIFTFALAIPRALLVPSHMQLLRHLVFSTSDHARYHSKTAIDMQNSCVKSEVPASYLPAELEPLVLCFSVLCCSLKLLDSLKLLNSLKPFKLVGSIFRRCGWVCRSSSSSDLTVEFLVLLLPHLLAATPDPELHRGRGLGGALTAHFSTTNLGYLTTEITGIARYVARKMATFVHFGAFWLFLTIFGHFVGHISHYPLYIFAQFKVWDGREHPELQSENLGLCPKKLLLEWK
ncbi:hypothetical protein DFH08DRAFT_818264 [Mycena albidolilacea]|uniref:Uncharacterized protein n=1 Tax=Mycena albidolilacea TaxID=1033008 RepID=A0AAD6ZH67_9AGAR|nr:hypothetical protein DFH08DRAFT_818264 [Mycena albidolilacea]